MKPEFEWFNTIKDHFGDTWTWMWFGSGSVLRCPYPGCFHHVNMELPRLLLKEGGSLEMQTGSQMTSSTSTHIQSQGKVTCPFLTTADSSFPLTQGGEEAREWMGACTVFHKLFHSRSSAQNHYYHWSSGIQLQWMVATHLPLMRGSRFWPPKQAHASFLCPVISLKQEAN
jgi:hypothetical protein